MSNCQSCIHVKCCALQAEHTAFERNIQCSFFDERISFLRVAKKTKPKHLSCFDKIKNSVSARQMAQIILEIKPCLECEHNISGAEYCVYASSNRNERCVRAIEKYLRKEKTNVYTTKSNRK